MLDEIGSPTMLQSIGTHMLLDHSIKSSQSNYSRIINETLRENDSMMTSKQSIQSEMPLKKNDGLEQ